MPITGKFHGGHTHFDVIFNLKLIAFELTSVFQF